MGRGAAWFCLVMACRPCAGMARPVSLSSVAQRARALSTSLGGVEAKHFYFDSTYTSDGARQRGWSNWLIDDRLMIGQYPHCQPAVPGPSAPDAQAHLQRLLATGIDGFVCLQAEIPPQDDGTVWPSEGVRMSDPADRSRFPQAFVRYAADVERLAIELGLPPPRYLYTGITDLAVPGDGLSEGSSLLVLLDSMLEHYEDGGGPLYVHWCALPS